MITLFFIVIFEASAVRLAMDPQNAVFTGFSYSDGGRGISLGLESRLTQLIYINMGGFTSIVPRVGDIDSREPSDWISMNHGIWAAPGWRVPHRYTKGAFQWDIMFRAGFACLFSKDVNREDLPLFDPAALLGTDFYLRWHNLGLRWSNKLFLYEPETPKTLEAVPLQRPQSSLEFFIQWN